MSRYDEDPGSLHSYEVEAFGTWAEEALPELDHSDDDAVRAAFEGPWQDFKDALADKAQAEIDHFEERFEMDMKEYFA